jgi:hypothetical protein
MHYRLLPTYYIGLTHSLYYCSSGVEVYRGFISLEKSIVDLV